ncbi:SRPBCC family protein [Arthrobacter sp. R-11]|uniref:SRPBCC family protein n=1 Tax=Arthrobacter sp. R-11 TaxID=3404053 RepID=UPI003CF10722
MATFSVSRNAFIPAPAAEIFPLVNDFHKWTAWSPWEAVDPNLKRSYSGNESGVGAKYTWSGNNKAGSGNMEIVNAVEPTKINIRLEFTKPMKAVNPTEFTFSPEGEGTRVTWTMTGENKTFMSKVFALFMNMDKLVGKDFEKGLASLGAAAAKRQG